MRSVVIASAKAAKQYLDASGAGYWNPFVMLTYRPGVAWAPEHISDYLKHVKRYCARAKAECRYEWVIELQPCGAPHYHVLFWLPYGFMLPKPDAAGMWPHGFSGIQAARNAVGYIVKYATKGSNECHDLPKNCRLFGVGGGGADERLVTHRAGLPMWLRELLACGSRAQKVSHVGWVCRSTGQIFKSPFCLSWCKDEWGIVVVTITRKEIIS
jgi:hypothetical protein